MKKKRVNEGLVAAIVEAAQLDTITEAEFEAELDAAGVPTVDAEITLEESPPEILTAAYQVATKGMKLYLASVIVARGLTACGCEACRRVEADARRWDAFLAKHPEWE